MPGRYKRVRVAVLESDPEERSRLCAIAGAFASVSQHPTAADFRASVYYRISDVIISDLRFSDERLDRERLQGLRERTGATLIVHAHLQDPRAAVEVMKSGAWDCLIKPVSDEALAGLLERACQEALRQRRHLVDANNPRFARLSERERQVLEFVSRGLTTKEIARTLSLSPRTVEAHRARMLAKAGLRRQIELLRLTSGETEAEDEEPWALA